MLAHSRIANTALKELNTLAEVKQGRHPALERTIQLQARLEAALPSDKQAEAVRSAEDRSLLSRSVLKENNESLGIAAQEVANYLREKRGYSRTGITELEEKLGEQLADHRSSPNIQTLEKLEAHTRQGVAVMKEDFGAAKEAMDQENKEYVRARDYLSEEGKAFILQESERGEFLLPNGQKGHSMESWIEFTQHQLEQYAFIKEKVIQMDQEPTKETAGEHTSELPATSTATPSFEKDYTHLSMEQQQRYTTLQTKMITAEPSLNQEIER